MTKMITTSTSNTSNSKKRAGEERSYRRYREKSKRRAAPLSLRGWYEKGRALLCGLNIFCKVSAGVVGGGAGAVGGDLWLPNWVYIELRVRVMPEQESIEGRACLWYEGGLDRVRLDRRLVVDSFWVDTLWGVGGGDSPRLRACWRYHGKPKRALLAPWLGGFVWRKDREGNPWVGVACESEGASLWYPCADRLSDEPDSGALIEVEVPAGLRAVSNGRLVGVDTLADGFVRWRYRVTNPINYYNITVYVGRYVCVDSVYAGAADTYRVEVCALHYRDRQRIGALLTVDIPQVLGVFEKFFGPYPFALDGYRIVESPYAGMEHQSSIAYGSFEMPWQGGIDTVRFDYILVHETAHEWWGNNVTAYSFADIWLHEGFATYAEALYIEQKGGHNAYLRYVNEYLLRHIRNKRPVAGKQREKRPFRDNDIYMKGALILHTLRTWSGTDSLFFLWLRTLQERWHHSFLSTTEALRLLDSLTSRQLSTLVHPYLYTTHLPVLHFRCKNGTTQVRIEGPWARHAPAFLLPVGDTLLSVTRRWTPITPQSHPFNPYRLATQAYVGLIRGASCPWRGRGLNP